MSGEHQLIKLSPYDAKEDSLVSQTSMLNEEKGEYDFMEFDDIEYMDCDCVVNESMDVDEDYGSENMDIPLSYDETSKKRSLY